jgi:hypothetical protein
MPIPQGRECYTLNHYHKNVVQQNLGHYMQEGLAHIKPTHIWQLVPDVFSLEADFENSTPTVVLPTGFDVPQDYVWQEHGYWHIGRSQVMFRKYAEREYFNNDMANQLKLNHMEMTFEPSWHCAPGEPKEGPRAVQALSAMLTSSMVVQPGMPSHWFPSLSLETFLAAGPPASPKTAEIAKIDPAPDKYQKLLSLFAVQNSALRPASAPPSLAAPSAREPAASPMPPPPQEPKRRKKASAE